jgi:hypothetical protein
VVKITTSLPEKPEIEVPVTVLPKRAAMRRTARRPVPKVESSAPTGGGG